MRQERSQGLGRGMPYRLSLHKCPNEDGSTVSASNSSNSRSTALGESRPVRRRTRTFRPNYLSFAGTYQCNLSCPHCCVPIEWPDRLDVAATVRFLEDAHAKGIRTLGFTGGEPFLYPEFVHTVCRRAAE